MRTLAILLLLSAPALMGCSAGAPRAATEAHAEAVFEVFGMDCPGCHGGVEKNLKKVPGVIKARANWSESRVTVFYDPSQEPDPKLIEKAVRSSNFTLGERLK